ncbi:type IV pilus biogenesis protein PilM [Falsibacillus albus]|uniref:Pilus assembly protein PilM n=1 Tax=Falsibacillus albus TaxID=2478915 RepID=A0A3L7KBK8_9BACI|nr:pilus assembly protein PilM [Falsibacillus albus]RLQ98052.1 hypothetical protein D9X91_01295 [Falsibacillus albus]
MAFGLFSKKQKISNLVLTDEYIRYADVKASEPLTVEGIGERRLPEGIISEGKIIDRQTLEMIMEECVEEWGIKNRQIRFTVPSTYIILKNIFISEDIHDDEIKSHLFLEIGTSIHLPFENPLFDIVVLGSSEGKKEVLLIAAPEDIILSYRELLEGVGLKPFIADISPLSLYRILYYQDKAEAKEHEMILKFSAKMLTVSIFHEHRPIFLRPIHMNSEDNLRSTLDEGNEAPIDFLLEDTVKEIEKVMNFYRYSLHKGEQSVTKMILTGDHPHLHAIQDHLTNRLNLNIVLDQPAFEGEGGLVPITFHTAIGLGLKEVL